LLRYAGSQPWGGTFRDTLPVAGVDGSLSDRFKNLSIQGTIHAKTGSLGGVKTLSGYATTDAGEEVCFSILTNNFNLPTKRVTDAIDDVVGAIMSDK
jgi:D-alanyl-D-alanine carboxypeptidase/D-alanyl-D-alanine-endopeptidase (penicillin-binding protein 4)